jgi:hypothetical protein
MAQDLYCWRCDKVVAMLDEQEWEVMGPALTQSIVDIQNHRKAGATLQEALRMPHGLQALQLYEEITGRPETNVKAIWHHCISIYGPPCEACGKPLRTPQASLCAACWHPRIVGVLPSIT